MSWAEHLRVRVDLSPAVPKVPGGREILLDADRVIGDGRLENPVGSRTAAVSMGEAQSGASYLTEAMRIEGRDQSRVG